jgi:hypothetical protein
MIMGACMMQIQIYEVGLLICNKMHVGNVREGVVRKLGMA